MKGLRLNAEPLMVCAVRHILCDIFLYSCNLTFYVLFVLGALYYYIFAGAPDTEKALVLKEIFNATYETMGRLKFILIKLYSLKFFNNK